MQRARVEALARDPFMRFCLTYFQHRMFQPGRPAAGVHPARLVPPRADRAAASVGAHAQRRTGRGVQRATSPRAPTARSGSRCTARRSGCAATSRSSARPARKRNTRPACATSRRRSRPTQPLRRDYPGLLPARDKKNQWISYTDQEVILSNGVRIASMPLGGNIRGQSYDGYRPDLVILDDPQNPNMARSKAWLKTRTAVDRTGPDRMRSALAARVLFLGTFLSHDCLLSWIRKPESETGDETAARAGPDHACRSRTRSSAPHWPAMFPYEECRRLESKHGTRALRHRAPAQATGRQRPHPARGVVPR